MPEAAAPGPVQPIGALLAALRGQAARTGQVLERLAGIDPRACTAPHPILGELDLAQWCRFAAYHLRVHRRQIEDVTRAPGFPRSS